MAPRKRSAKTHMKISVPKIMRKVAPGVEYDELSIKQDTDNHEDSEESLPQSSESYSEARYIRHSRKRARNL